MPHIFVIPEIHQHKSVCKVVLHLLMSLPDLFVVTFFFFSSWQPGTKHYSKLNGSPENLDVN
jgi:hypothetical protein